MDQLGIHLPDEGPQSLHVLPVVGAVRDALHLPHPGPGLIQRPRQGGAPGHGYMGLEPVPAGEAQIVEDHPPRPADVGVADDIQNSDHASSLPSGSSDRLAARAPRAR